MNLFEDNILINKKELAKLPVSLIEDDEEAYASLRQYIINSPLYSYDKTKLPFEEVEIVSYDEYQLSNYVSEVAKTEKIFSIKKKTKDENILAYGYYVFNNHHFVILKHSIFTFNDFSRNLLKQITLLQDIDYEVSTNRLSCDIEFPDAACAASFVLGNRTTFIEWISKTGQTLKDVYDWFKDSKNLTTDDNYYLSITSGNNKSTEKTGIKAITIQKTPSKESRSAFIVNQTNNLLLGILEALATRPKNSRSFTPEKTLINLKDSFSSDKHVFYIKNETCEVKGIINTSDGTFSILEGSFFRNRVESGFIRTKTYNLRVNFIRSNCLSDGDSHIVMKNYNCQSASSAASIILGKVSHHLVWKDSNGKGLSDIYPFLYPNKSKIKEAPKVEKLQLTLFPELENSFVAINKNEHFYLESNNKGFECKAEGFFDPEQGVFFILSGSQLSNNVTPQYRYSAEEFERKRFLQKYCRIVDNKTILLKDHYFSSIDLVTNYVRGFKSVRGTDEWVNIKGQKLSERLKTL